MNQIGNKSNSFLNREWGRVKGKLKKHTTKMRRLLNKKVIINELKSI